jgi:hypothetical protein
VGGALTGGAFAQAGVSFLDQQLIVQPVFALATIFFARQLIADAPEATSQTQRGFAWPARALLIICMIPIGALMIEGAMMEWSALFLRDHLAASPLATALVFSVFALSMAFLRLAGDRMA